MNTDQFKIEYRKSRGNLHVRPRGNLDNEAVRELLELIHEKYERRGFVFIDTSDLSTHDPGSIRIFKTMIESSPVVSPADLVFKGAKGMAIAPDGSRVLSQPRKRCCGGNGNCANCSCHSSRH
jgi:hypothetical protein